MFHAVPDGATVVFSAHGVSPAVRAQAADRELEVIDATCPLVTKVHAEARRFDTLAGLSKTAGSAGGDRITVVERETTREDIQFTVPLAVRRSTLLSRITGPADFAKLSVGDRYVLDL